MPVDPTPPDNERVVLHDTMFAYAGTYSLEVGKVIHHIDISWNQAWTGTDQIRYFEVSGNTLALTMRVADSANDAETRYVAVWEKVEDARAPRR